MVLSYKKFRSMVVDAYVYHKHWIFCVCTVALTLQLKLRDTSTIGGETGMTSPLIVARRSYQGRAYDRKESTTKR
jgi:hypothetical protein